MVEVSENAIEMVKDFLKNVERQWPVRLVFTQSECDQPAIGMTLSESQDGDKTFDCGGVQFVVEGPLYDMAAPIQVDLEETPSGTQFLVSCGITENTCTLAEQPDACQTYCMTCTCQGDDPLAGLPILDIPPDLEV